MGFGLLLVGVIAGAAGAQVVESLARPHFLNSGLFTLAADEVVHFNVTLDDGRGPEARVLLQLFDEKGDVVKRQDVSLVPGQSATLDHPGPGVFRAHAQIVEPSNIQLGARRIVVGTVEILGSGVAGVEARSIVGGPLVAGLLDIAIPRRFVCSSDDGGGNGRLPD